MPTGPEPFGLAIIRNTAIVPLAFSTVTAVRMSGMVQTQTFRGAIGMSASANSRQFEYLMVWLGVISYGLTLYALWIGVHFGFHWDERIQYDNVINSYQTGLLLPRRYNYPAMIYWVGMASVADRLAAGVASFIEFAPRPAIPFDFFILRARALAMVTSSLGAWWIFFALRASPLSNRAIAPTIGLALYLFSWEFGYHARWLAPDMIVAQFVALFILCLAKAERSQSPNGWIMGAAVAAGLAISTKYTAGGLIFALWLYILVSRRFVGRALVITLARLTFIAAAVYLVVTPGTLLDPIIFQRDVLIEVRHYATGHSASSDIGSFWVYLARMWEYLGLAMMSPQPMIGVALAALALWGLVPAWHRSRPTACALGFLMVFYSLFWPWQVVFIVRNFLMLLPIFCYLAAIGYDALLERALAVRKRRSTVLAATLALAVIVMMGWNAWEQLVFGRSIVATRQVPLVFQAARYLSDRPAIPIALSPRLSADLVATGTTLPTNAVAPAEARRFLFLLSELAKTNLQLPGTRYDSYEWIGAREVNLNYYPNWKGRDHVIILDMDAARRMGIVAALYAQ